MQSPEVMPLRWGWIAVLFFESGGGWVNPTEAARMTGIPTAKLRRWAERGIISVIHDPGQWRRYYIAELDFLASWETGRKDAGKEPLNLPTLIDYIDVTLANGLAYKPPRECPPGGSWGTR